MLGIVGTANYYTRDKDWAINVLLALRPTNNLEIMILFKRYKRRIIMFTPRLRFRDATNCWLNQSEGSICYARDAVPDDLKLSELHLIS
jgi:hypothetical protein